MTLNQEQFIQFIENYATYIVEGLDAESMEQMLYDLLVCQYEDLTEEQIVDEIEALYGEEVATDLLESATVVPVA
tara:strand:+ start:340 stop:564 length:225 start_codon:yes stop_codon:yes gene_type:complete